MRIRGLPRRCMRRVKLRTVATARLAPISNTSGVGVLSSHMSSSIRCWVLRMGFHCPSSIINRLGRASAPQWGQ